MQKGMSVKCQVRTSRCYSITSSARARGRRNCDAECFRGLEIDHQLVLVRCLYRQIGRLLTPEDTINVTCRPAICVEEIRAIRKQSTLCYKKALNKNRREFVPGSKLTINLRC